MNKLAICLAGSMLHATAAQAQLRAYVGVEGGVEQRQTLPDGGATPVQPLSVEGDRTGRGFAFGAFAGLELPVGSALFAGAELGVGRSEADTRATQFRGVELVTGVLVGVTERIAVRPRWSYAATGRIGFNLSRTLAAYGLVGASGERVRVAIGPADPAVGGAELRTKRTFDGVVFGGGARLLLSDRVGARIELRRTETKRGFDPEQLLAGLLFRL